MKMYCVGLGCPKNQIDLEMILGAVSGSVEYVDDPAQADVILVNTCAFIQPAKLESIETILELAEYKKYKPTLKILVTGCLPQRYRDHLPYHLPEVDAFFDSTHILETRKQVCSFLKVDENLQHRRVVGRHHSVYLRIADGCDNRCSYCAIPLIKGSYHSRPMQDIIDEANWLAEKGAVEINLVAQDTTLYGHDLYGRQSLHLLLPALHEIKRVRWWRLLYTHPAHWYPELFEVVAELERVVKYVDLPIQHISDPILRQMNRKCNRRQIEALIDKLRSRIPNLALRTTVMVGFPGETEAQFQELYQFLEKVRFERLGVFEYSAEEDTPAALFKNIVSASKKQARKDDIMTLQAEISFAKNQSLIGQKVLILIDEQGKDKVSYGRTQWDAPEIDNTVNLLASKKPGSFVTCRIIAADCYDLKAVPIRE